MLEAGTNRPIYFIDALFVVPLLLILIVIVDKGREYFGLDIIATETWENFDALIVFVFAVFLGDFIGYWRHRLEHMKLLWPAHAVHHSDTSVSWLTLFRFHPINRVTTYIIDASLLAIFGFPEWALIANNLFRHYYGHFIHADIPWTYGPLSRVFISPVAHRWHHVKDVAISGSNFATVFSVFDRAFGTYYERGLCLAPLGVSEYMGKGVIGQLTYPFIVLFRHLKSVFKSDLAAKL